MVLRLFALAPGEGRAEVQVIDAPAWSLRKSFGVPFSAYDLTADDRGRVYLSGEARDWTDVAAVDAEQGAVLARWGGIWTRSLLRLSADQKRLYVATQGAGPC